MLTRYELNIYGNDDEIVKTFSTNHVPWGLYLDAADADEKLKTENANAKQMIDTANGIVLALFPDATIDDLRRADARDVVSIFKQITHLGETIETPKNA